MLIVSIVEQHSILLLRCKCYRHIGSRLHIERLQLHIGTVVEEAEAGEVLTPLATVARGALADVVVGAGLVHADPVFTIVLLTGRGLGVEVSNHGLDLTELASVLCWTLARVLVHSVSTRASVLTHVIAAVINIGGAVLTNEAQGTLAGVVGEMILALASVLTGVLAAERDLLLTISSLET